MGNNRRGFLKGLGLAGLVPASLLGVAKTVTSGDYKNMDGVLLISKFRALRIQLTADEFVQFRDHKAFVSARQLDILMGNALYGVDFAPLTPEQVNSISLRAYTHRISNPGDLGRGQ